MLLAFCIASAACAALPAVMTLLNLREYMPPPASGDLLSAVTVIIPARNEEAGIAACIQSVLHAPGVPVDVLVIDDSSTDRTASIVEAIAASDARVHLLRSAALPAGWNGKQHACWQGAHAATQPLLCFLDADVRLRPGALERTASLLLNSRVALVSGFPHEVTGTFLEKLLIPLIHFILLGLLPMRWLRTTSKPEFAAGCGQFLLVERDAYFNSGGHERIRATMHDGLLLPRLLRQNGFRTLLTDLTNHAECRMYTSAASTWNGLAKNATEGIAKPARIVPITLLLGLGQVLPLVLLYLARTHVRYVIPFLGPPLRLGMTAMWFALAAFLLSYLPRLINAVRYRQSWLGALLHPLGVLVLLVLQWFALLRKAAGKPATWKAREYVPE